MGRGARLSTRLDESVIRRLENRSARTETNRSRLVERYLDEGLRMDEHPGIVFREGPAGRRAALAGGPDVWEVMSVIQASRRRGDAAVGRAAEVLNLPPETVRIAVRYYSDYPTEIDQRIQRHHEEADSEEAAWRREQDALA